MANDKIAEEFCGAKDSSFINETPPSENSLANSSNSSLISNQNLKVCEFMDNSKEPYNNPTLGYLVTENSCNAVDNTIRDDNVSIQLREQAPLLSFNGQISFTSNETRYDNLHPSNNDAVTVLNDTQLIKNYTNVQSPDLFADDDLEEFRDSNVVNKRNSSAAEKELLKRIEPKLNGVLPPPSLTQPIPLSIDCMLGQYFVNIEAYTYNKGEPLLTENQDEKINYLNKPQFTETEIKSMEWPQVLHAKAHGISYNKSTVSEQIEWLAMKYGERYIGSETSSSLVLQKSPSSSKKRSLRIKMLNESPGNRLSYLAKRRKLFTSNELFRTTKTEKTAQINPSKLCNGQILLNSDKTNNRRKKMLKTPKRRGGTPKRKSLGSSKKKLVTKPVSLSRETSKRALFQSPPKEIKNRAVPTISRELAQRADRSKRALFSPAKPGLNRFASFSEITNKTMESECSLKHHHSMDNISLSMTASSSSLNISSNKRIRQDDDDNLTENNNSKIPRLDAHEEKLTPNSLRFARSQTFCVSSDKPVSCTQTEDSVNNNRGLYRANSEFTLPVGALTSSQDRQFVFTANHKKKIFWAVSQALQGKKINVKHDKFKEYASMMARIVKRLFLEYNDTTTNSTSEKLLKFANNIAYSVIKGKSFEDIYNVEKIIMHKKLLSTGRHMYERRDNWRKQLSENVCRPSSTTAANAKFQRSDSLYSISEGSDLFNSQLSILNSENEFVASQNSISSNQKIMTTELTTSTSKNNDRSLALRENIDYEQKQKSSQKTQGLSFSGKDQKNVSPYSDRNKLSKSNIKLQQQNLHLQQDLHMLSVANRNILRAKRQITFDS